MDTFDLRNWPEFEKAGGCGNALLDQIAIDSRRIDSPNSLFVALKGEHVDGHQFVREAAKVGARFALVKKDMNFRSKLMCRL